MHRGEFENQEQIKAEMSVGNLGTDARWQKGFSDGSIGYGTSEAGGGVIVSAKGVNVECMKVKNPSNLKAFPEVGVAILKAYGNSKPLPMVLRVFDTSGTFSLFSDSIYTQSAEVFPEGGEEIDFGSSNPSWSEIQNLLNEYVVGCSSLFGRDKENNPELDYKPRLGRPLQLSPPVERE